MRGMLSSYKAKRVSDPYVKAAISAGILALAVYAIFIGGYPCPFLRLTGHPCPGCGMTHAVRALLRGDIAGAFRCHEMFWSVPLLYLYFLTDFRLFSSETANVGVLSAILFGFVFFYLLRTA